VKAHPAGRQHRHDRGLSNLTPPAGKGRDAARSSKRNLSFRRLRLRVLPALVMNSTSPPTSRTCVSSPSSSPARKRSPSPEGVTPFTCPPTRGPTPYPSGACRRALQHNRAGQAIHRRRGRRLNCVDCGPSADNEGRRNVNRGDSGCSRGRDRNERLAPDPVVRMCGSTDRGPE
jgi:hypothetical protein